MTLEGQSPWEQPAADTLNACRRARDSRKGRSPETAAREAGMPLRRRVQSREKRYVGAFRRRRLDTLREGKAPKGESRERCRCETKTARDRREKAVMRVTKP
jgi:hypothetical protein